MCIRDRFDLLQLLHIQLQVDRARFLRAVLFLELRLGRLCLVEDLDLIAPIEQPAGGHDGDENDPEDHYLG